MKLICIRHGQTNYNVKDLCNGKPNPKVRLTALGRQQAKAAADILKKEKIDVIFISQLRRSQQTAQIINRYHNVPLVMDKRLNDRQMGPYEDKPASLFYAWRDSQRNPWTATPRGGESYESLKKRAKAFLSDLARTEYKAVLIVTHLPVLKVIRGQFKGLSNAAMDKLDEKAIPNCKVFRFSLKPVAQKKKKA